jgi:outer membrane protein assembly factor BamB
MVRPSRLPVLPLALLVGVLALVGAACSSDDDGAAPGTTVTTIDDGAGTTTTASPLDEPVTDACGNDLAELTSTVWGVDPAGGAVRWSTSVPLAEAYLVPDPSGDVRLSLTRRGVEALVDPETGDVVDLPAAGVHEVLVDAANSPVPGSATLIVDGERQPPAIEVEGASISTGRGSTGQTTVSLTAVDPSTAAPLWSVELGAADEVAALSPPVLYGDTVVVVVSPPRPSCP